MMNKQDNIDDNRLGSLSTMSIQNRKRTSELFTKNPDKSLTMQSHLRLEPPTSQSNEGEEYYNFDKVMEVDHCSVEETEEEKQKEEKEEKEVEEELVPEEVLTKDQLKICQNLFFEMKDYELGGFPVIQLGTILRKLGFTPSQAELLKYQNKYDTLKKGVFSLEDVCIAAAHQSKVLPISNKAAISALEWFKFKYPKSRNLIKELLTCAEPLSLTEAAALLIVGDPERTGEFNVDNVIRAISPKVKAKKSAKGKKKRKKNTKKGKSLETKRKRK